MKVVDIPHELGHSNFDVLGVHAYGSQHEVDAGYRFDSLRFVSRDNNKVRLAFYKIGVSGTYSVYALLNVR